MINDVGHEFLELCLARGMSPFVRLEARRDEFRGQYCITAYLNGQRHEEFLKDRLMAAPRRELMNALGDVAQSIARTFPAPAPETPKPPKKLITRMFGPYRWKAQVAV